MKKWAGLLFIAALSCCAIDVFAGDQGGAVSTPATALVPQPIPVVPQGDFGQAPANVPEVEVKVPIDFGDNRSSTLTSKAWKALVQNDLGAVLDYTNKCISLYAAEASKMQEAKMQANLIADVSRSNKDISQYWALNDVAASYYIQGEAYRAANKKDKAEAAYKKLISEYSFGQVWDPKGWFWKPADSARERLETLSAGDSFDFDDFTSTLLVQRAWVALSANNLKEVEAYADKVVVLYGGKAKQMQAALKEYAWGSKQNIMSYWALNDVGTILFVLGEAYQNAGKKDDAIKTYKRIINEFGYSQCWDPGGWFWKPAESARQKLNQLENA